MVSLFGHGNTTSSLAKLFNKDEVVFFDDNADKMFIDKNGYKVYPSIKFNPNNSNLEIPSPGIAPSNPLIQKAKNLISEYDFFASSMPNSIWVSGTNGKTTTTQMITHLLKENGAISGGNIGTPLAELDKEAPLWILETSSFTLHYTNVAKPQIYVLLPIKQDHLSWHGSFESYEEAKLKPLKLMDEGDIAIVPKKYENISSNAMVISYENVNDLSSYFEIDLSKIKFKGAFLFDSVLALATTKILFDRVDYKLINNFEIEANRQELIKDKKQRIWINDTKATNIDATIACVDTFDDKFIHLILGGDDKGVSLDELFLYLKDKKIKTYHIGSNKQRLSTLAKKYNIDFLECKNLEDAIENIDKNLKDNEYAILSPAAASLDEFKSYAHRGEEFKKFISKLS